MSALISKLEHFTRLSSEDKLVLRKVTSERVRQYGPHEDIVRHGENPKAVYMVREGWSCRYKYVEDGRRQIVAFFLPGDICDLNVFILHRMDHSIGTITRVSVAEVDRAGFDELMMGHPRITQALWWETLVAMAIQREWTVNLGQRYALERIAHLLCELFIRLRTAGLASQDACAFPLTQAELGDATGLSTVHVNRTLQELRAAGLISLGNRTLKIHDLKRLMQVGLFNPDYLHLDREGAHLDANI